MWTTVEHQLPLEQASGSSINASLYGGIAAAALLLLGFSSLPTLNNGAQEKVEISTIDEEKTNLDTEPNFEMNTIEIAADNEHLPQENHEIELVSLEAISKLKTPISNTSNSKKIEEKEQNINEGKDKKNISESFSGEADAIMLDFKATGIQCIAKTVHFESTELSYSLKWIIDGVHVFEGNSCDFSFNEPGEHEVVMLADINNENYSVKKSIEIFERPTPVISYSVASSETCFEQSIELSSQPGTNAYSWSLESEKANGSNVSIRATEGRHQVYLTAVSPEGCVTELVQEVFVEGGLKIFIPNSFTPDNDGQNDSWFANGLEKCASFSVQVYRASDQSLVYETNNFAPWNGNIKGTSEKAVRGEKFLYRIASTDNCGFKKKISGTITSL